MMGFYNMASFEPRGVVAGGATAYLVAGGWELLSWNLG